MQPFAAADPYTGLSVDSSQFRRRAPRVNLSKDPDTATQQTVQEMCRQIHQAAMDPLIRAVSFNAVRSIRGGPLWVGTGLQPFEHPRVMAESCWWWAKHTLRFKHHSGMFEVWSADLGDPRTKLQLLISPDVLVRMRKMEGDCAIYTMMIAAMLEALGLKWEICTGAVDASQPDIFSHVWPRVVLGDGGREPLDASHGRYPGWQVPAYDIHRLKVWNSAGAEVANQARRFDGLHAYRSRRGFGDVCFPGDPDYDAAACAAQGGTSTVSSSGASSADLCSLYPAMCANPGGTTPPTFSSPATQITVPAANTAAYANLAASLIKQGFTLAELNAMQPGTVINPNGQIVRQAPGYAVTSGGAVTGALPLSTSSISSMLPWLVGLGVVGFLFMGGKR